MSVLNQLNSPFLYLVCGGIVLFVALVCVFFMIRAYKAGLSVGMDPHKLRQTITASATFAVLPSVGILLGVIALSGSLGIPLPWLRLSVIGALHYETQVAEAAAEQLGITLAASQMTIKAFVTIALLMSFCIIWSMVMALFFNKKYTAKLKAKEPQEAAPAAEAASEAAPAPQKKSFSGFADQAMTAMFIGLVSAYIGSYIGTLTESGNWLPLAVAACGALAMGIFMLIKDKKKAAWVDSFSIAGSMIFAMAAAVFLAKLM